MNTKNLLIASLVGGIATAVLSNVPIVNLLNCVVCAGFWLGPLFAVWLYRRQTGTVTLGQGVGIGTLAGVWAGIFGFLLSLVGLAGAAALAHTYSQFLPADAGGFDPVAAGAVSVLFNLAGVGVTILFGAIGGLIGGAIFQTRPAPTEPAAPAA